MLVSSPLGIYPGIITAYARVGNWSGCNTVRLRAYLTSLGLWIVISIVGSNPTM